MRIASTVLAATTLLALAACGGGDPMVRERDADWHRGDWHVDRSEAAAYNDHGDTIHPVTVGRITLNGDSGTIDDASLRFLEEQDGRRVYEADHDGDGVMERHTFSSDDDGDLLYHHADGTIEFRRR